MASEAEQGGARRPPRRALTSVQSRLRAGPRVARQTDQAENLSRARVNELVQERMRKEEELPDLVIVTARLSLYSEEEMQATKVCLVNNNEPEGSGSLNDPRMGVVGTRRRCGTCDQVDCPGHFGLIKFPEPIPNPLAMRTLVSVLTSVCNTCGSLLMSKEQIEREGLLQLSFEERLPAIERECKKGLLCTCRFPEEGEGQGTGPIIPCQRNPVFDATSVTTSDQILYSLPKGSGEPRGEKTYPMPLGQIISILRMISPRDSLLMGFGPHVHPSRLILYGMLVSPPIARPPILGNGVLEPDPLTNMFGNIVRANNLLEDARRLRPNNKRAEVTNLFCAVKDIISNAEGRQAGSREFISLINRMQGKEALMRGLLMGKRNGNSGRCVLGPETNIRFGEIRTPEVWADILTVEETVFSSNLSRLAGLLEEGKIPRITAATGRYRGLRQEVRPGMTITLNPGDRVERWLQNGDFVVFNRQPTIHKHSLLAYRVVLGPFFTWGLHLSSTTPHNADFDGDEGNGWVPLDFEVMAESQVLMWIVNNMMTDTQNRPVVGLVMESVAGCYLLSNPNPNAVRLDASFRRMCLDKITERSSLPTLDRRLAAYGVDPLSGAGLLSALFPEDFYYSNGDVLVVDGVLLSGSLTSSATGPTGRSLVHFLWFDYGPARAAAFLSDATFLALTWTSGRHGFSIGLSDVVSPDDGKRQAIVRRERARIRLNLRAIGGPLADPTEEAARERRILAVVDSLKGVGADIAEKEMGPTNGLLVASEKGSGAKGKFFNLAQIKAGVGQQFLNGQRIRPALTGGTRCLPSFDPNDPRPEARGYCPSSYWDGLSPEEFFFTLLAGRENLIDTAIKTAEVGTVSRRTVKIMESLAVATDGSTRNAIGTILQPLYGGDGLDGSELMRVKSRGYNSLVSFVDVKALATKANIRRGWLPTGAPPAPRPPPARRTPFQIPLPEEGPEVMSRFEYAAALGKLATLLSSGELRMPIASEESDPLSLARLLLEEGLTPLLVRRRMPDGTLQSVGTPLNDMLLPPR